jgi:hypothetical protein
MKLGDVVPSPDDIKPQLDEQQVTTDLHLPQLYGIDPASETYADTMSELARIKKYNPKLYNKIVNLG